MCPACILGADSNAKLTFKVQASCLPDSISIGGEWKVNSTLENNHRLLPLCFFEWYFVVYLLCQQLQWWEKVFTSDLLCSPPQLHCRLQCNTIMPCCHLAFIRKKNLSSEIGFFNPLLSSLLIIFLKSISSSSPFPSTSPSPPLPSLHSCSLSFISNAVTMALILDAVLMIGN